jgi:hypothetical protein
MTIDKRSPKNDPWLGAFCPENTCLREEERLAVAPSQKDQPVDESSWLNIFCPKDRCQAETPTHAV